jgi:hypothetical protein
VARVKFRIHLGYVTFASRLASDEADGNRLCSAKVLKRGYDLRASLIADTAGTLYTTAESGGPAGYGTVVNVSPPAAVKRPGQKAYFTHLVQLRMAKIQLPA